MRALITPRAGVSQQGGANIREIQRLLGHRHLTTTALYTKVDTRGLAAVIRRCHPREKGVKWR